MKLPAWALTGLLALASLTATAAETAPWSALREGGHVLILRHAVTEPGIGDPPQFKPGDCSTQRNLSATGRAQAQRLGKRLAEQGTGVAEVLSSRWCRCMDTARLAFGKVSPAPELDSFFGESHKAAKQTAALRKRIADFRGPGNLVLVTHQVNITELTGAHPAMGETIVLKIKSGQLETVGRIPPP